MTDLVLVVTLVVAGGWALGWWMDRVFDDTSAPSRTFARLERPIWLALGVDPTEPTGWRRWGRWLLVTHLVFGLAVYAVFLAQGALPGNPDGIPGLSWDLALHTSASFLTNTDQQHYSGQAQLSYLAQVVAVTTAQVVTPAVGLAVMLAVVRGLRGGVPDRRDPNGDRDLGNPWSDLVRSVTRVLLPLTVVWSVALASQGVPATLRGAVHAVPLDAAAMTEQVLPLGPVAPMVAIKQLGTNGGGWYGPNSAFPFENPTPLSNVLELVAILLVPIGCAFLVGRWLGRDFGRLTLGVMGITAVALAVPIVVLEQGAHPAFDGLAALGPNWEGKELRFGVTTSALWAAFTTLSSNGSVNAMHDSLLPLSGLFPFAGMFANDAFGGVGVGFLNFLLYLLVAVFVAGLLIGRTPELLQRKVEAREIRLVALAVLLPAVAVLVPTALSFSLGFANASHTGPHAVSQVLYEYASAAANNGSGFEGLGDNTVWWNTSCAFVLILCRFVPILAPLAVSGLLAARRASPVSAGTLPVGSPAMGVTVLSVIVIVQLLTWVPALVLGPVAEHLVSVPALAAGAP